MQLIMVTPMVTPPPHSGFRDDQTSGNPTEDSNTAIAIDPEITKVELGCPIT